MLLKHKYIHIIHIIKHKLNQMKKTTFKYTGLFLFKIRLDNNLFTFVKVLFLPSGNEWPHLK